MDFNTAVVVDESRLTKLFHEMAYARSGGADHLGERLLTDLRDQGLRSAFLAEIRQQQEQSRQPFLSRVEELIEKVFFNADISGQHMRHEHLGKCRLAAKDALNFLLSYPHGHAFG